ncbi:MAG: 4-hydroxybenzoate octaprenyltransferase [Granulosicoccus sp.]|nr:4-hydroxybenzoate octaprenyltransferase [Granulosicoccus sp.]
MNTVALRQKLPALVALTRLNRPIGIYLLLWPMLCALWFAANGFPDLSILLIFIAGTVLTRSAGCAINDYADRNFDAHVSRTKDRPLATGELRPRDAIVAAIALMSLAFFLVLLTNALTVKLSFLALALAMIYPWAKRYTHLPQIILGAAFAMAVPMAFTAQLGTLPASAWYLFGATVIWAVAYDTLYAMADRSDDLAIGIKSSAILFGRFDLLAVAILQFVSLALLVLLGWLNSRGLFYYTGLACACGFIAHQLYICRDRDSERCLQAFKNNHWLGMCVFIGLAIDYLIYP